MAQSTLPAADLATTIPEDLLAPRESKMTVRRAWRQARRELRSALRQSDLYLGGQPAELASRESLRRAALRAARLACRRAWTARQGRRIDLAALLNHRRADGTPVWTIGDPAVPTAIANNYPEGRRDIDGSLYIGRRWRTIPGVKPGGASMTPTGGVPPLPAVARRLLTDRRIRRRAVWVGLLYQPEGWAAPKPDPAVVVEWECRPGEYYALAVWGPDRPRIMEWVD